jgi:hypothetical protein
MERLTQLRARGQFAIDNYRPFYFEVAEVVRAYLGARYRFDSLELTTTELTEQLQLRAPHLCEPGSEVLQFLGETDLVKFAKTGSSAGRLLAGAAADGVRKRRPQGGTEGGDRWLGGPCTRSRLTSSPWR